MPGLHHVELWVGDLARAESCWQWLLGRLGFVPAGEWSDGFSYAADGMYITIVEPPGLSSDVHDRRRPGLNHLAFQGGTQDEVDATMRAARLHGWSPLYQERYPHAGGADSYAGWLQNVDGFKVEIVRSA